MRYGGLMGGTIGNHYAGPSGAAMGALMAGQAIGDAFRNMGRSVADRRDRDDRLQQQARQEAFRQQQQDLLRKQLEYRQQRTAQEDEAKKRKSFSTYWYTNGGEKTDPGGERFKQTFGYLPFEYIDNGVVASIAQGEANRSLQRELFDARTAHEREMDALRRSGQTPAPKMPTAPGYETFVTPEGAYGMRPIPGGPADMKQQAVQGKENSARATEIRDASILSEDIGRAMQLVGDYTFIPNTGLPGTLLSHVPGTAAADLDKVLDTIKANVGFAKLQEMRANSPTGGALGSVSEKENRLLQSVLGSLEQSQSQEQLMHNLKRLQSITLDIIHGAGNWRYNQDGSPVIAVGAGQRELPPLPPGAVPVGGQ